MVIGSLILPALSEGGDDFSGSYSSPRDTGTYEGSFTSNHACTSYWGNWEHENGESGFFALQIGDCLLQGKRRTAKQATMNSSLLALPETNTEAFPTSSTTQVPCTVTS